MFGKLFNKKSGKHARKKLENIPKQGILEVEDMAMPEGAVPPVPAPAVSEASAAPRKRSAVKRFNMPAPAPASPEAPAALRKRAAAKQPDEQSSATAHAVPEVPVVLPDSEEATQTLSVPDLYDLDMRMGARGCIVSETAEAASSSLIGTRSSQQDATAVGGEAAKMVCVLCDGMGGLSGGEKASALAAEGMLKTMLENSSTDYPQEMCRTAVRINEQVKALCDDSGNHIEAGTTLTTVVISGSDMYWCSIGDSHIYIYRGGRLQQLNEDHNLGTRLDQMVLNGIITEEEARSNPKRAALTSYLGISELTLINRNPSPIKLQPGDMVLQCSDGLYRCMSEQTMAEMLSNSLNVADTAKDMVKAAVAKPGAHDNTTVVITRYRKWPVMAQKRPDDAEDATIKLQDVLQGDPAATELMKVGDK